MAASPRDPVVTVDPVPTPGAPAVNVDARGGARTAARHLLDLGHRRIGIVTLDGTKVGDNEPAAQRGAGWCEALAGAGVEPLEARAAFCPVTAAYDAALDRPDHPTALLCFSDVLAAQAVRAASDPGLRVPEDLSVVDYDDADFAPTFRPALTTVRQQVRDKGRAAVAALTAALDGEEPVARALLPTQLVVRESTGPAPA